MLPNFFFTVSLTKINDLQDLQKKKTFGDMRPNKACAHIVLRIQVKCIAYLIVLDNIVIYHRGFFSCNMSKCRFTQARVCDVREHTK